MNKIILTTKRAASTSKAVLNTLLADGCKVYVVFRDAAVQGPSHFHVPGVVFCNAVSAIRELGMENFRLTANKNVDLYNLVLSSDIAVNSAHYVREVELRLSRPKAPTPLRAVRQFFNEIEEIFEGGKVKYFSSDTTNGTLNFEVHDFDVQFEHLARLSELLGTRKINLSEKTEYGGCDTCGHGATSFTPIYCSQVKFA